MTVITKKAAKANRPRNPICRKDYALTFTVTRRGCFYHLFLCFVFFFHICLDRAKLFGQLEDHGEVFTPFLTVARSVCRDEHTVASQFLPKLVREA